MTQKDKTKAAALVNDLLAGLSPDEARAMIAAEEQRRLADEAQREAARAALLLDKEAEDRRLRAERERQRQLEERALADARKRAVEARQAFDAARAALLSAAANLSRSVEAHRRQNDRLALLVDREPGELYPWERPVPRFSERDAVRLRDLELAG